MPKHYSPSTLTVIGDLIMGVHVETTGGVLVAANFTATQAATIAATAHLFYVPMSNGAYAEAAL